MTVIPESLRDEGNNLAGIVGLSMADTETYDKAPQVQDAEGNLYRWANAVVSESFWDHLSEPLVLPEHDDGTLDLVAAQSLLDAALILAPEILEDLPEISGLVIAPNMDPQTVLSGLGLIPLED